MFGNKTGIGEIEILLSEYLRCLEDGGDGADTKRYGIKNKECSPEVSLTQ